MSSLPWLLLPPPAPDESAETAHELEPQRLIQELHRAGFEPLPRETVDRILARGAECAPLLLDVLDAFTEDLIEDGDPLAARSLVLLGEIGEPSALPEIASFFVDEEEDEDAVSDAADWAFHRIATQQPEATLEVIAHLGAAADAAQISQLCKHVAEMPDVPARAETVLGFAGRLDEIDPDARALVVTSMAITAMFIDGPRGELVASIRQRYGAHLTREAVKAIEETEADLIREPYQPEEERTSVYELACEGFQVEQPDEPYVREEPKLGRNDPCWCGSGKKYKKCHLAADEERGA